jgi:hypothetical protein
MNDLAAQFRPKDKLRLTPVEAEREKSVSPVCANARRGIRVALLFAREKDCSPAPWVWPLCVVAANVCFQEVAKAVLYGRDRRKADVGG